MEVFILVFIIFKTQKISNSKLPYFIYLVFKAGALRIYILLTLYLIGLPLVGILPDMSGNLVLNSASGKKPLMCSKSGISSRSIIEIRKEISKIDK